MASEILDYVKAAVRVKSDGSNEEIDELICACKRELELAGVYITDENDPLAKQAIKLYCKGYYGYDDNTEKFIESYKALRDAMALSGEYTKESADGSKTHME